MSSSRLRRLRRLWRSLWRRLWLRRRLWWPLQSAWRAVRAVAGSRVGGLGLGITAGLLALALFADVAAPYPPLKSVGPPLRPPNVEFPMGTDDLGRDVLSGVIHGARTSMAVGLLVAALAAAIGTLIGVVSAYFGGWIDDSLMRLTEFFQVLPRFFLAVVVIAFFGASIANVILVLGLTSWTMLARIVRSEVLTIRARPFVEVSRAQGAPDALVMRRHVLPHALPAVVVTASLLAGQAILIEAGLSFLGLGDPNAVSWGYMLNNARSFLRVAWWTAVFPGLAITLATLGVNLAGDGVNDARNPRRRA